MADCLDCPEGSLESIWGVECLWVEHPDIEGVLRRVTSWWHGVGEKPRLAATLFELKRGFDKKGANASQDRTGLYVKSPAV